MKLAAPVALALLLAGASAAFPLASPVDAAIARSDGLIASLGAIDGPASAIDAAIAAYGIAPTDVAATRSGSLEAAILRAYDAYGVEVDDALAARVAAQARAADSPALLALFDAVADAQLASLRVWTPEDRAFVADDLATTMKMITLLPADDPARAAHLAALQRADLPLAAGAAVRLADAIPALEELAPAEGCGRVLDLPFFQIGAPCDDVYAAGTLNFIEIDYGGNDRYLHGAAAGIAGVGVSLHIDYGDGADVYDAPTSAQAFSLAGVAILVNEDGADSYSVSTFGQGFSAAGVALLYDGGAGDDRYVSPPTTDSLGTKGGGLGGVGILVDEGGSELYQQDGLDGFVYGAQGVGILVDQGDGDDSYVTNDNHIILAVPGLEPEDLGWFAGPVQVSAEVNGLAVLYEEGGDDTYLCGQHVRQGCQGAAGIGSAAFLLDLAGDDVYQLGETVTPSLADVTGVPDLAIVPAFPSGQGVAYGESSAPPGVGVAVLRDVSGSDAYLADRYAQGYATGGLGLLFDEAGADTYVNALAALSGARGDGQTWADGIALGVGIDSA